MKILMLFKAIPTTVWKAAAKLVLVAAVAYVFFSVGDYIIFLVSLCITVAHLIAVILVTILQCQAVYRERRMGILETIAIAAWFLIGLVPALAFGYAQWTYLILFPWKLLLPSTVAFACLYAFVYWMWLYRIICDYTEGRDYSLANNGSSGAPHMPTA